MSRFLLALVTAAAVGLLPGTATAAVAVPPEPGPQAAHVGLPVPVRHTVTYHVEKRGRVTASMATFRRQAQRTLDDPRGWRSAGVRFRRVATGGDLTLVLSQAARLPSFSPVCSVQWSCRVGRFVVVNQTRWLHASPMWNRRGRSLRDYRHMVVNHEVGHWLGHGHRGCPRAGALAPVMQPQSKGLVRVPAQPVADPGGAAHPAFRLTTAPAGCGRVEAMIVVSNVTKRYGGFTAVDDVSFTARQGRVTGFLGPNGAGKSTTMRIMVGLTPASGGKVTIGGHRYSDIPNPARHVGVLLDASAQHAGRTGREILALGATTMGLPERRVDEMLELVSLTPKEAKRRVRHYSLGMRQRLGIAHALLGEPQVLILDEPANGLDPAGIHWMRGMLGTFARGGGTVLLSSHLLHEVEMIADDMVLIGNGRIVAQGTKQELLRTSGTLVQAVEAEALRDALATAGYTVRADAAHLHVEAEPVQVGEVAAANRLTLVELRPADGAGLEALFLELTADTQREGVVA